MSSQRLVKDTEGLNTASWPIPAEHFITPTEHFFTRSHAPIPTIDPLTWRLEVRGLVARPGEFALDDLTGRFPRRQVCSTLVCAGLRRDEFFAIGPLPGELPWGPEPISTGEWSGIALRDLLDAVGIEPGARHVELIGLDCVERQGRTFGFGGSIDLDKARSPEVLLATELNGAPLPRPHGFPLRAVVPGWIGARSVKWLGRINLIEGPSDNYFESKAYRDLREANPADPRDVTAGIALTGVPLNAVIISPADRATIPAGPAKLRGWAMGAGAAGLRTVEVSADGGQSWIAARFEAEGQPWAWRFWEAELTLAPGHRELTVRAADRAGNTMPASAWETWNVKGYNNNAWHRVGVRVK